MKNVGSERLSEAVIPISVAHSAELFASGVLVLDDSNVYQRRSTNAI